MRKLIVSEFITLDGVVEAPGGEETHPHTGWVLPETSEKTVLELDDTKTIASGVVVQTYHPSAS